MPYHAPTTLREALAILADGPATVVAGGTDVFPALADRPLRGPVVDLSRLEALRGISREGGVVRIGARATWSDLVRAPLPAAFDGLKAAAREVGAVQIQNRATLAGNLVTASPAADGVPCLLALDAAVELVSANGTRRLALRDFVTGVRQTALVAGELVGAILVPAPPEGAVGAFQKLGARRYLVISIAMASALVWEDGDGRIAGARVAVGACSPVAQRLTTLEAALRGVPRSEAGDVVSAAHLAPLSPIDDIRASAAYRRHAAGELVRRVLSAKAPAGALAA